MKARSVLHALNCRMSRMDDRLARACIHTSIHNTIPEMIDGAWEVIPRTALEKLHNAAVKFVGSIYKMEKESNNPHRPRPA